MAQSTPDQEDLCCPICLDLLKDFVTIPCGHNYCMKCINLHWDQQKVKYSCPLCRESFSPRPVLVKNISPDYLAQLKKTELTTPPADVDSLHENICSQHKKEKNQFCRTDQQLICCLCSVDQHKGHRIVTAATETTQRQGELPTRKILLLQSLQTKENDLKRLQHEAQDISRSAQTAVQCSGYSFKEMFLLLEKRRSEVEKQIRSEEQTQLRRVKELQDRLQKDVTELKKRIADLDTLSLTPDPCQFLKRYYSLSTDSQSTERVRIQTGLYRCFEDVTKSVLELKQKLELTLKESQTKLSLPSTREDFLQYSTGITLDPKTAHNMLSLSDGNRRATVSRKNQMYPDHPDRFSHMCQVLSRESLRGRCYFEVEWSGQAVRIGLSYRDIQRKGNSDQCVFGNNDKSWALHCNKADNNYYFLFDSVEFKVVGSVESRIGVYLDYDAGILSFYSVSKTMTLLHRVQTTFTQPLYAGVWICWQTGNTANFSKLK